MYVSQTPKFRSPTPPLKAALSMLEGYDEHEAALTRCSAALAPAVVARDAASRTKEGLGQAVLEQLLTDDAKPADLLKSVTALASHADLAQAERVVAVLDKAQDALLAERDAILTSGVDSLFRSLDGSLQDAVAVARSADLAGVTDAESAIEAGKPEQWAIFAAARTTIHQIRASQATVLSGLVQQTDVSQHRLTFGAIKNYAASFPGWLTRQQQEPASYAGDGSFVLPVPPWPEDPNEFVLFVAQHPEVELWVPTVQQVRDAYELAHKAAKFEQLDPEEQKRADRNQAKFEQSLGYARNAAQTSGNRDDY